MLGLTTFLACDTSKAITSQEYESSTTQTYPSTTDPLPSWNAGKTKNDIITFVKTVTAKGSKQYVKEEDRIAAFDNDGTLWAEQPNYFQGAFIKYSLKNGPNHPLLRELNFFKKMAKGGSIQDGLEIFTTMYAGMNTQDFEDLILEWLANDRHPDLNVPYTDLVYQPMLELLNYLRANGFKTFICSGGGTQFMRPWTYDAYGIPKNQIIGTTVKEEFKHKAGKTQIIRTGELEHNNDKEGKPIGLQKHIGKKPIFSCGNSDGDLQMMQWTDSNILPNFELYLHHTDGVREWNYSKEDNDVGKLKKGLAIAKIKGWTVIDMRTDWNKIFPEVVKSPKKQGRSIKK